jgi:collagenase-like PrtC family protease
MELVVHIQSRESLAVVQEQGAEAVAVRLPRNPEGRDWSELADWRARARKHGLKFYLVWDGLLKEGDLAGVAARLASVARLDSDGVQLRDLGLVQEVQREYPQIPLISAGNWGAYNSPAVRLAELLGFTRVVLEGGVSLKDLALMRRQTAMPLMVTLPPFCRGYPSLCLLEEYTGGSCEACCLSRLENFTSRDLMEALEMFSGLNQLGVEAVQIRGELFAPGSLGQVIRMFKSVAEASPIERPQVVGAVKEVLAAFGEGLVGLKPSAKNFDNLSHVPERLHPRRSAWRFEFPGRNRIWLEARDYADALALSREWREPLLIALTPDTYAKFLPDHRRWGPRRLIWRLPPAIRESTLAFYQKALETLGQGGYYRFVAGDWGAVALIRDIGGQVYGDQTLGVRNSWAVKAARSLKVTRVCLPPGQPAERQEELLKAAPTGSFWSYLYRMTPLALCPKKVPGVPPRDDLGWFSGDGGTILGYKTPQDFRGRGPWFREQGIFPLIVSLPRRSMPRGQLPDWLKPRARTARFRK